jgi:hypothetical protein
MLSLLLLLLLPIFIIICDITHLHMSLELLESVLVASARAVFDDHSGRLCGAE